jgi:gluconate 2-dehydrogenase gamma chain
VQTSEKERHAAREISRRDLLKRAGVAGVVAAVPAGAAAASSAPPRAREREQLEALTAAEADTVEAIVERLVPSEGDGLGAAEARVARYIDRALAGEPRDLLPSYSANLAALDVHSQATFGDPFAQLSAAEQDAILTALEQNRAPGFVPSSAAFFETVREHTLQGMFGDPFHGGNDDFVGWDLLGFPGIRLQFKPKEQELDVVVKPAHKSTADFPQFGFKKKTRGGDHA